MFGSGLHITIFEGSLIRSPSRISGCDLIVQPGWEVIHLEREMTHAVHEVHLIRVWRFPPDDFRLTFLGLEALQRNICIPVTGDRHECLMPLFLLFFISFEANLALEPTDFFLFGEPSSFVEVNEHFLVGVLLVNPHLLANVEVGRSDDEIVE